MCHQTASGDAFVDHICVRKDRRRCGIGTALLHSLSPPISLITRPLTKAMTFYMHMGFETATSPLYAPKGGEMAMRATHIDPQTQHAFTIRHTTWSEMALADQADMIELAQENPCEPTRRLSRKAALRVLCVGDPNVRYVVVD